MDFAEGRRRALEDRIQQVEAQLTEERRKRRDAEEVLSLLVSVLLNQAVGHNKTRKS